MQHFNWQKALLMILATSALAAAIIPFIKSSVQESNVYAIGESGWEAVIVSAKMIPGRRRTNIHQAEYENFASDNGPVDMFVVPINQSHKKEHQEKIRALKKEFSDGMVPKEVASHVSGKTGRIRFIGHEKGKLGLRSYLVLIRSPIATNVTMNVYYGP